eukprot:GHVT01045351.1.p1 GENE.GHVT01045351.1~~GHVT01045351.1.p1  ORF type:complete len:418 (+),score=109.24 GHVT01045351.1:1295-2548(+)
MQFLPVLPRCPLPSPPPSAMIRCAKYCAAHLHKNILSSFRQSVCTEQARVRAGRAQTADSAELTALTKAVRRGFVVTDNNFLNFAKRNNLPDGCTAVAALLFGPDTDGGLRLVTAHCGDSRAVLCRGGQAVALTLDHKPNNRLERERIERAGGVVMNLGGTWRLLSVSIETKKAFGLATSRAFGDAPLKQPRALVVVTPDVSVETLSLTEDSFLVLATDGVFDVLSEQELVEKIQGKTDELDPDQICKFVCDEATRLGSEDDKTCVILFFCWGGRVVGGRHAEAASAEGPATAVAGPSPRESAAATEGAVAAVAPSAAAVYGGAEEEAGSTPATAAVVQGPGGEAKGGLDSRQEGATSPAASAAPAGLIERGIEWLVSLPVASNTTEGGLEEAEDEDESVLPGTVPAQDDVDDMFSL